MKYARKLAISIPDNLLHIRRDTRIVAEDGHEDTGKIFRWYVTKKDSCSILSLFPNEISRASIAISVSKIDDVNAHVHTREECVLNMYIQAGGSKTVFYDGEIVPVDNPSFKNTGGHFFANESLLTPVESFEANDGDVWVLNTKQPHGVVSENKLKDRWVLQVYLSLSFDSAIKHLINNGL